MKAYYALTYSEKLKDTLLQWGFNDTIANYIVDFSVFIIILFSSVIVYYILKFVLNRFLKRLVERSSSKWDDYLYEERVFTRLALLIPALILQVALTATLTNHPQAVHYIDLILKLYMIAVFLLVIISFLNAVYKIYGEFEVADSKPIKGYIQIAKIIVYVIGGIVLISAMIGQSPVSILAGLGAISAVLLLIFKDSILGFVAGVQLSGNNMLKIGDWISLSKHNADGIVIDISLVTVKIRNWDNSVTLVPTYTLVTESFMNWRSMMDAGGRRMRRFFLIDVRSIHPVDDEMLNKINELGVLQEIEVPGGGQQTNLGLFRQYIGAYVKNIQGINPDAGVLIRLLQAAETGLPVEITLFTLFQDLSDHEGLQSRLFEHIYSVLPLFGLQAYQRPGTSEFNN